MAVSLIGSGQIYPCIFMMAYNRLTGSLPEAIAMSDEFYFFSVDNNRLHGTIPDGVGSAVNMQRWWASQNRLSGTIPDAFASMTELELLDVSVNQLSGTIPAVVPSDHENKQSVHARDNKLSGSLPSGLMSTQGAVLFCGNRLIGTLPSLDTVVALMVSRNLLEGTVPNIVESRLRLLDLGGEAGRVGGLHGSLPSALHKASHLRLVAIATQQMEGIVPSFTSTLSLLSLHTNRFKVLPEMHLEDNVSSTAVLLHDNLLSCHLPWCGNASASVSIIAIGNHLQHPKTEFPAWVSEKERDPLLWVSGTASMSLLQKISAAVGLFVCVVAWKLGRSQLLTAISGWQIGPATHLWVVQASSHLVRCMAKESLAAGSLPDAPSFLGPLRMPSDIGIGKRLLTEQHSHPKLGLLVLVQILFALCGIGAVDVGRRD